MSLRSLQNWLNETPRHTRGVRYLQVCIGAVLLFRVATEGPFAAFLWGPHGIGYGESMTYLLGPIVGTILDSAFTTVWGTYAVLGMMAAGAVGLLAGYRTRLATFLALLGLFMIEQRLPEVGDGGDNITRLALVYMLFLVPHGRTAERGSVAAWMHNVAILALIAQLIILYVTSGLMKAYGEKWHHGTAMYYISQVEWISHPFFREILKQPLVTTVATYVPIFFMVLFPVAIFSRFKLQWIAMGIGLHLGIGVVMGLVTFSAVMIGMELLLITNAEYDRITATSRQVWRSLAKAYRGAAAGSLGTSRRPQRSGQVANSSPPIPQSASSEVSR